MTVSQFLAILAEAPLIASVQASPQSPVDDPHTLLRLAQTSLQEGVRVLRLEGLENITLIKSETKAPTIGLIKRGYPGTSHYITPTLKEVDELLSTECEVIALDARSLGTESDRLTPLVDACHRAGRLVLADCTSAADIEGATRAGCDLLSTTFFAGGPGDETFTQPQFEDLGTFLSSTKLPVIAEGLYQTEAHIRQAIAMGAKGVVVGGALNDPIKLTKRFVAAAKTPTSDVGACDIGGTRLRFGRFSPAWRLVDRAEVPLPPTHAERLAWIAEQCEVHGTSVVGISTGGVVDPRTSTVVSSTEIIPGNEGSTFDIPGVTLRVINDGLATAWGHCLYRLRNPLQDASSSDRTVTIAVGTGLGCGVTTGFGFLDAARYPRLNDVCFGPDTTLEQIVGGASLSRIPDEEEQAHAQEALNYAIDLCAKLYQPSEIFLCGGVALSDWMRGAVDFSAFDETLVTFSPFGPDAGLYGAAALALFPPIGVFLA